MRYNTFNCYGKASFAQQPQLHETLQKDEKNEI